MKIQGMFKTSAHFSLISVHVAVDQRCRARNVEPTAILPSVSTRVTFQWGAG